MAALTFFADDSYDPTVSAVAGYLGELKMWQDVFSPAWNTIINNAPRPLTEFAASDCQTENNEFKGWSWDERRELMTALVDLLVALQKRGDIVGFGAATTYSFWIDEAALPSDRDRTDSRYKWAQHGYGISLGMTFHDALDLGAQACARAEQRARDAGTWTPDENWDIQPILDEKDGFAERALINFHGVREYLGSEKSARLKPPILGESVKTPPLQAADLFAYEVFKEAWGRAKGAPVRKGLDRLVCEGGKQRAHCLAFPDYEGLRPYMKSENYGNMKDFPLHWSWLFDFGGPVRAPGNWRCD